MINQFACEYIHYSSIGNLAKCKEAIQKTKMGLEQLYKDKNIIGYQLLLIKSSIDAENEVLEDKFFEFTEGKFPFIYSFVQPAENGRVNFDKLMKELHYIRVTA